MKMTADIANVGKEAELIMIHLQFEVRTIQDGGSGVILLTVQMAVGGATVALSGINRQDAALPHCSMHFEHLSQQKVFTSVNMSCWHWLKRFTFGTVCRWAHLAMAKPLPLCSDSVNKVKTVLSHLW